MTSDGPPATSDALIRVVDDKLTSVRTTSLDLSFNELADMYSSRELIIDPEFQRMFRWSEGKQSRFIESLILELPVPPIFLIEQEDRIYELIDGLQRISSYLHFRDLIEVEGQENPLRLEDCDIVPELNGRTFSELPRSLDIKLKRSSIRAEILRKESDPRLRYYMFKRLNTGGETLEEQEIRNATIRLLSNDFNAFIIELSGNPDFAACIDIISDNAKRQKFDQELVLRFFSFKNDFAHYKHDVSDFMTNYMEYVSDPSSEGVFDYGTERTTFVETFALLHKIADKLGIGGRIFGTVTNSGAPRSQFSVYHYEGIVLGIQPVLGHVDVDDVGAIDALAEVVIKGKADKEFLANCGAGKNYRNPMNARVEFFARRFQAVIDGRK
jgi:hypothetical protein